MAPAECNYDVHDKAMLEIVQALKEWKRYVKRSRRQVKVLTDHKNLVPFMTSKDLSDRPIRWMEVISGYDFKIEFRPEKEHGKQDALTRKKPDMPDKEDERITQKRRIVLPPRYFSQIEEIEVTEIQEENEIQRESTKDTAMQKIRLELEKATKEMKGVALGLCQWKDDYL